MSVLYKGLNPKHHYGLCILTKDGELITANGKHFQAKQIPKGHGRIIDGDYAKYNLENYGDLPSKYLHMDLVREAIEASPTILEAEE